MNWLDWVLIVIVAAAALMGMRTGIIGAAITAAGVIIGWLLAGQWADEIGSLAGDSLSADKWITVVAYVIIIAAAVAVAGFAGKFIRPLITVATLGLAGIPDKIGGLALGLIIGIAVAGALVIALARLTYDFELPDEGIAGSLADRIPNVEGTKEKIEDALSGSAIVSGFIDVTDALPASALGFVPEDFQASLNILEQAIE
jgi:uncharacterized membrane protein required for colicin V production